MTEKSKAITMAEREAEIVSTVGWGLLGFFVPVIGLLVVYLRAPKVSVATLASYDDQETVRLYERHYIDVLKARQVKSTWIGVGLAIAVTVLAIMLLMATVAVSS